MNTLLKTFGTAVLTIGLAGSAFAQSSHQGHGSAGKPMTMQQGMAEMQPKPGDSPFVKEFKEAHGRMMMDMHFPLTGDPDVDFRKHMIPHHQGAIDMAKIAIKYAKDPETKKMSQMIIDAQEREIAEMQDWLKKNGK